MIPVKIDRCLATVTLKAANKRGTDEGEYRQLTGKNKLMLTTWTNV